MNKSNIKAILFDLDDTLWAIEPVLQRAENLLYTWLEQHAPNVTRQHTIDTLRQRRQTLLHHKPAYRINLWTLRHTILTEVLVENQENPMLADDAMRIFSDARNAITPFDDVVPTLTTLQQRLALGSISNGFADLTQIGLASHFQVSIAAHQFDVAKPDPSIFHAACAALHISPEQAVYVGDDPVLDVAGAQQAGLQAVWMNRFQRTLPPHIHPATECADLLELQNWLTN